MMCPLLIDCVEHVGFRNLLQGGGLAHSSGNAARLVLKAGGSLRDGQQLAGHRAIDQTQAYIDGSARAKRRLI
jgi:integrase/recombinase XerD